MKVTYDPQVDVLYVSIRDLDSPAADNVDLVPGISADLDADGRVLGIEILDVSEKTGEDSTTTFAFELLGADSATAAQ